MPQLVRLVGNYAINKFYQRLIQRVELTGAIKKLPYLCWFELFWDASDYEPM